MVYTFYHFSTSCELLSKFNVQLMHYIHAVSGTIYIMTYRYNGNFTIIGMYNLHYMFYKHSFLLV